MCSSDLAISSAPTGGVTGIATANLRGGIVVCTGAADPGNQKASVVQSINLINPGSGYTSGPTVQIFGDGVGAAATANMANGTIGIVTITGGGSGYTTTPTITFTGLSTVSAAATAIVSTAGTISAIHITNAGAGYTNTNPPIVMIEAESVTQDKLSSIKYDGDFGDIVGIATTAVAGIGTALQLDLYIPDTSILRDTSVMSSGISVSGIQSGY